MRGLSVLYLVILFYLHFFSLAAKLKMSANGHQFFKNVDFSVTYPLKGV